MCVCVCLSILHCANLGKILILVVISSAFYESKKTTEKSPTLTGSYTHDCEMGYKSTMHER